MVVSAWLQLPDSGSGSDLRPMTSGSDTDPTLSPGVSPREGACHHRTVGQNSCLEAWKNIYRHFADSDTDLTLSLREGACHHCVLA